MDWNEAGGWIPDEKKMELEDRFRDRLMDVFLDMVRESGYQLGGVEMLVDSLEVVEGGVNVRSGMGFYWLGEENEEKIVN